MFIDYRAREGSEPVARVSSDEDVAAIDENDEPAEAESPTEVEETATPTQEPEDEEKSRPKGPRRDRSVRLITEGISVQVLNGTDDAAAGQAMAERLMGLGYQVVTVESTSKPYKDTTVYWSFPNASRAGRALATRFGWVSDPKPNNLADTVSLHVVVGRDFVARSV
jgi:hypothetical protein